MVSSVVLLMLIIRITAYMKFSLIKQPKGHKNLMIISRKMERH